jgi:hypothetical protein
VGAGLLGSWGAGGDVHERDSVLLGRGRHAPRLPRARFVGVVQGRQSLARGGHPLLGRAGAPGRRGRARCAHRAPRTRLARPPVQSHAPRPRSHLQRPNRAAHCRCSRHCPPKMQTRRRPSCTDPTSNQTHQKKKKKNLTPWLA